MEASEIISEIECIRGYYPEGAIRAAIERREELTPVLLEIIRDAIADAEAVAEDGDRVDHLHAMYLLAYWREPALYPLLIEFARLPGELPHDLGGSLVTEDLGRMLATVCGDDLLPIYALIEDASVEEFVRAAAIRSLLVLVVAGRLTRDEVIAYFKLLFNGKLERKPSQAWSSLAAYAADLQPAELMQEIRRGFEEHLIDPEMVRLEEVERDSRLSVEDALAKLRDRDTLMGDPVKEMSWWHCFQPEPPKRTAAVAPPAKPPVAAPPATAVKSEVAKETLIAGKKVGRNDPCPCGSGKKHKKCCGRT